MLGRYHVWRAVFARLGRVARIHLGLGSSHGPMLSIAPEFWPDRVLADRANPRHFFQGKIYTFDQMAALRREERLGDQASAEVRAERYARCQRAIAELGGVYLENMPDVLVVVGNDQ